MYRAGIRIYGVNSQEVRYSTKTFFILPSAFHDGVFAITKPQLKKPADYISLSLQKHHHIIYLFEIGNTQFVLYLTGFLQNPTLSSCF